MRNVLIVLKKEWLEITQQRILLLSVILPPLIFSLLPIALILLTSKVPVAATRINSISALPIPTLAHLSPGELAQGVVALQFSVLYLVLPVIIPSVIAAYSIVGEKSNRTLEPLLATPVKTWEPSGRKTGANKGAWPGRTDWSPSSPWRLTCWCSSYAAIAENGPFL